MHVHTYKLIDGKAGLGRYKLALSRCLVSLLILLASPAFADTKTIVSEATYIMGDGESPFFAESMAIQKAKQVALEVAGTYVESSAQVRNYQLTADEIRIIAGGVIQVKVLEKSRTLVEDGLRFWVKINAEVTTDKVAELAQRIKGNNITDEYKKLQKDYEQLSQGLEALKKQVAQLPPGKERDTALDQLHEQEKAFATTQNSETAFFQRLVSGASLVQAVRNERSMVDKLIQRIIDDGYLIEIGEVQSQALYDAPESIRMTMLGTLKLNDNVIAAISATAKELGGETKQIKLMPFLEESVGVLYLGKKITPRAKLDSPKLQKGPKKYRDSDDDTDRSVNRIRTTIISFSKEPEPSKYFQEQIARFAMAIEFHGSKDAPGYCLLRNNELRLLFPVPLLWDTTITLYKTTGFPGLPDYKVTHDIEEIIKGIYVVMQGKVWDSLWYRGEKEIIEGGPFALEPDGRSIYSRPLPDSNKNGWVVAIQQMGTFRLETVLTERVAKDLQKVTARFVLKDAPTQLKGAPIKCSVFPGSAED